MVFYRGSKGGSKSNDIHKENREGNIIVYSFCSNIIYTIKLPLFSRF